MNDYRNNNDNRLYRSDDAVFFGVCGGIAEHLGMAPWGVRVLFIILQFLFPPLIIIYIVLGLALKKRPCYAMPNTDGAAMLNECGGSRAEMLRRLQGRFVALDQRLRRLESIVTRPSFGLEDEYRNL